MAAAEQTAAPTTTATSVFAKQAAEQYAAYDVTIVLDGKLMGGVPKSVDLIEGWLRKNMGITDQQELHREVLKTLAGTLDEPVQEIEDAIAAEEVTDPIYQAAVATAQRIAGTNKTTGFKFDSNGLYIEGRQLKAMMKECTNVGFAGERWGATRKGPKSYLAERVFVNPDRVYLGKQEPDGIDTVIGHVSDASGKRATLGYHEYVENVTLNFQLVVLDDSIRDADWPRIWIIAENNGLGALRSQGFGTFKVTAWTRSRDVKKALKEAAASEQAEAVQKASNGSGDPGRVKELANA